MMENYSAKNKQLFNAIVCSNKQIGQRFYRLGLEFSASGAEAFAEARPGQFAQLDLADAPLPPSEAIPEDLMDVSRRKILLRRPFSFTDVTTEGGKSIVDILYRVVGPASLRMTALSAGDSISVIGPLGSGFRVLDDKKTALLVGGGIGAGPLLYLTKVITTNYTDIKAVAFAGAKTVKELPFGGRLDEISQGLGFSLREFARYGIESLVATDDGSAGYEGFVTDCLAEWLGQRNLAAKDTIIYSCGPEAMLAQVAKIAQEKNIDCQVSMERMIACGIGVCQSCAVECKVDNSNKTVYKLCCKDGPVFNSRDVVFSS